MITRLGLCVCLALLTAGCGGGSSTSSSSSTPASGGSGGGAVNPPVTVSVASGPQGAAGVNITVVAPAGTPPNAELLGVGANPNVSATLTNTGASIKNGTFPKSVFICGHGLPSGNPANILVTIPGMTVDSASLFGINCPGQSGQPALPGIGFNVTSGAVGVHTVILQDKTNNNITTFTGGLEVTP